MSETKTRKPVRGSRRRTAARNSAVGPSGPVERAGAATIEVLDRMGMRWVLDLLATGAAAGIVVGGYGIDAGRAQLQLYTDAWRAVAEAQRNAAASLAKGEVLAALQTLADAVAQRIADFNRYVGVAGKADFDEIGMRLDAIERRIAGIERARRRKPRQPRAEELSSPALTDDAVATRTDDAAQEPAAAASASRKLPRVDDRPIVDTSSTMFIGSVPAGREFAPAPVRASSMSSKPDAMSAYLAKKPGAVAAEPPSRRGRGRTEG